MNNKIYVSYKEITHLILVNVRLQFKTITAESKPKENQNLCFTIFMDIRLTISECIVTNINGTSNCQFNQALAATQRESNSSVFIY